jgi:hypothetical protein
MSAQPFFDFFSKARDASIVSPTNGQTLVFDQPNGKWENVTITSSTEGLWNFSTILTMGDPGSGRLRVNNATVSAATQMVISVTTNPGTDVTNVLRAIQTGDQIVVQDKSNAANWIRYTVAGAPTNNTTWFLIPLTFVSGSGTTSANNNLLVVAFQTTGPGGGGGGSGTVTTFSAGNLGPVFTTAVANPSTTPNLSFSISTCGAHTFLGNNTGSTAAPTYVQLNFTDLAGSATDAQVPDILTLTRVSNLTTNGFVKTGSANGTLSVDTAAYLTGNQSIALSGDITGSGSTAITTTYNGAVPTAKGGVPTGGTTGQTLSKNSATNYDAGWATPAGADLVYDGDYPTGGPSYTDGDIVIQNEVAYMCVRPTSSPPTTWPGGVSGGSGLPTGGTANQILSKNSGTNYDASWTTVSTANLQTSALSPAGTTSGTGVMAGLGALGAVFTPVKSGTIFVTVSGSLNNNTATGGATVQIRYGTGTAPANGAALTGTVAGQAAQRTGAGWGANQVCPYNLCVIITGLSLGVPIWIDCSQAILSTGTMNFTAAVAAFELP